MLSFLLIFISSTIFLLPRENKLNEKIIYAALFTSFPFSQLLLGFISLQVESSTINYLEIY